MHSKKQTIRARECTPDRPNRPPASHLLSALRSAPPTHRCFLPSPALHKPSPPPVLPLAPASTSQSSPPPSRKRSELAAVSAARASIARLHRRTLSVRTPSYCEKMLRLSLARDEHAQAVRPKPAVFDATYSPDGSESSSSSHKYGSQRSRSPSPPARSRVPRSNTVSHPRSASQGIPPAVPRLPRSHTHPSDLSAATLCRRPSRNRNEEVLRSRLEGVLSSASSSRDVSCPPSPQRRRAATSGESSFGLITPPHTLGHNTLPMHPSMARSKTSPAVPRSSRSATHSAGPITPPPSPPFDANRIALQLRDREGYVSFADVQGLGVPHDNGDDDECDPEHARGRWWSLWKG